MKYIILWILFAPFCQQKHSTVKGLEGVAHRYLKQTLQLPPESVSGFRYATPNPPSISLIFLIDPMEIGGCNDETVSWIQKPGTSVMAFQNDFLLDELLRFDSYKELKKVFGEDVIMSRQYYPDEIGRMGVNQNTLLFPGTKNQVEFVWLDDSINFNGLAYINLVGHETDWRTSEGITLGTSLKQLEAYNKKPFTFYGFGWEGRGAANWQEGRLFNRKIFVSLELAVDYIAPEFEQLIGDHVIRSDSELAQKSNPIVWQITMKR